MLTIPNSVDYRRVIEIDVVASGIYCKQEGTHEALRDPRIGTRSTRREV